MKHSANKWILTILIVMINLNISCSQSNKSDSLLLKCITFPTGVTTKMYQIEIFNNGKYNVKYGEKLENENDFSSIKEEKSIVLEQKNLEIIKSLLSQVENLDELRITNVKKGGWEVIFFIDDRIYQYYIGDKHDILDNLLQKIASVSPLYINIQSNS